MGPVAMGLNRNAVFEWHKITAMFVSSALNLQKPMNHLSSTSVTWVVVLLSGAYLPVPFCLLLFLYAALQSLSGAIPCHNVPHQFLSCSRHVEGAIKPVFPAAYATYVFCFR